MDAILSSFFNSLLPMAVLVLATLGITLIFKTSYTTNFAQGSFAVISGYSAAALVARSGVHVAVALPVALAVGFAFAVFVDSILFRFGRHVNPVSKQIITMGMVILITAGVPLIFGAAEITANMSFFSQIYTVDIGSYELVLNMNHIFCFGVTAVVVAAVFILLKFSKWGMSVRATASNEVVAQMMGINTRVVTAFTWGIAGALAALAGIMQLGVAPLTVGYMVGTQVDAFMAGILGGMTSFGGPIVGAFIIPIVRFFFKYFISFWADVCLYLLILFVVLIKPNGLLGKKFTAKV